MEHMQVRKDGVLLSLTLTEYRILLTLVQHQGIVSRGALLEALWDVDSRFIDYNTLSVHISRLREKIGAQHIRTMRAVINGWTDLCDAGAGSGAGRGAGDVPSATVPPASPG